MGKMIDENIKGWGILLDGNNCPTSWKKISGYEGDMVILEDFGQYPKRLVLECASAGDAQEGFDSMIRAVEQQRELADGF